MSGCSRRIASAQGKFEPSISIELGILVLPDKEFRYLRHSCYSRCEPPRVRSFLSDSLCRHRDRTVPSPSILMAPGVQSLRLPR